MFKKILIANRGEIAVRIARTCREMGVQTVAVYEIADQGSLHVRLADECVLLNSKAGFRDPEAILRIAKEKGAEAIHPGYGFLAEQADFIRACDSAGIAFIGPPADVVASVRNKIQALESARSAGVVTTAHSPVSFEEGEMDALRDNAMRLGFPLVVKSVRGGRGRGEQWVPTPDRLEQAVRRAQVETQAVYGERAVYLEKAIRPAHQIGVPILADKYGSLVHFDEREGSLIHGNQKVVEESPAPCLNMEQRQRVSQTALELARLFNYENLGTVEFLVDQTGNFFFTEIKARTPMAAPVTELLSRIDLIREQIRIAAGEALGFAQADVLSRGWAMECNIRAQDPSQNFMPSPGRLRRVRLPGGPEVRVDTYAYSRCNVPSEYDPLIAKVMVWGPNRALCLQKMQRAMDEFKLIGTATNTSLLQQILREPAFVQGTYTTEFLSSPMESTPSSPEHLRDLAVAGAVLFARSGLVFHPVPPERSTSGWHRDSRRLPE